MGGWAAGRRRLRRWRQRLYLVKLIALVALLSPLCRSSTSGTVHTMCELTSHRVRGLRCSEVSIPGF